MNFILALLIDPSPLPKAKTNDFSSILNAALEVAGALALLMLVIGGFRYIISDGNPEKMATSRRMIIYSIIGLAVIALAYSIVNLILNRL
jgi:hypothetical protein